MQIGSGTVHVRAWLLFLHFVSRSTAHWQGNLQMLTPFTKPKNEELPADHRRFNYLHSLTRGAVERALGILKARFRWMLRGIHLRSLDTYVLWFMVCVILHNMCIDAGEDPDVVDAEPQDAGYGGLAACADFTLEVRQALERRTQVALEQVSYGTVDGRRRRKGVVATSGSGDAVEGEDVSDQTGEDDTRAAKDVMLDTTDGKILRNTVFSGLRITEWLNRKKPRLAADL